MTALLLLNFPLLLACKEEIAYVIFWIETCKGSGRKWPWQKYYRPTGTVSVLWKVPKSQVFICVFVVVASLDWIVLSMNTIFTTSINKLRSAFQILFPLLLLLVLSSSGICCTLIPYHLSTSTIIIALLQCITPACSLVLDFVGSTNQGATVIYQCNVFLIAISLSISKLICWATQKHRDRINHLICPPNWRVFAQTKTVTENN